MYKVLYTVSKISNEVGKTDDFRANRVRYFYVPQRYVRILFIFQCLVCLVLLFLTPTNMNLAVYGNGSAILMTS